MNSTAILEHGPVRLKACRYGPLLYWITDTYIGQSLDLYGEFSEGETGLLRQIIRPGATVVEVGANIGAHTVCLAKAVGPLGKVLAFEPQRLVYQMLCGNVALNVLTNVHTHHAAVGRAPGTITVPTLDPNASQNFGSVSLGAWSEGEQVPVVTLDSLNLAACDLIKIDVERMELEVLLGAEQTIRRLQPVLYMENEWEEKSEPLIRQLMTWNYRLYWHFPLLFNPANHFQNPTDVFHQVVSTNMLCVPANVQQNLAGFKEITDPQESAAGMLRANRERQAAEGK